MSCQTIMIFDGFVGGGGVEAAGGVAEVFEAFM